MYAFKDNQQLGSRQLAELLSIDRRTVWQRCKDGRLPHTQDRTGHRVFVFDDALRLALAGSGCHLVELDELSGLAFLVGGTRSRAFLTVEGWAVWSVTSPPGSYAPDVGS